jgi:hypothetical protein
MRRARVVAILGLLGGMIAVFPQYEGAGASRPAADTCGAPLQHARSQDRRTTGGGTGHLSSGKQERRPTARRTSQAE